MNYTIYSRDGCPYCQKIVTVMQHYDFKFVEYKLGRDFDRSGFYSQFGEGATFPQVVEGGKNLGGCVETVQYLREQNLL
jgi:glutaredoxin|tara:strand:+ start:332 stop:568 length:237 start_codon:yes stop_codon:yes gene_type:complete